MPVQYVYLGEHAGIETAERFLANAGASLADLSKNPGMGAPLSFRSPKLAGLRKWRVSGLLSASPGWRFNRARLACRAGLVEPSRNSMSAELPPPSFTVRLADGQIENRGITKAERGRLKRVAALPDDQIDTSDIPDAGFRRVLIGASPIGTTFKPGHFVIL